MNNLRNASTIKLTSKQSLSRYRSTKNCTFPTVMMITDASGRFQSVLFSAFFPIHISKFSPLKTIATEPRVLQCGVVSAGIAGLGTTIALSNAGHDVEIFERSQFKQEVGAAITMTPNAGLILDHWGFDQEAAEPTDLLQFRVIDSETLELINRNLFEEVLDKYRHRMAFYHRVDLHSGIRRLAEQHSSISIKLGAGVTKLDCDTGTLGFADGSYIRKDLVIVADGTNSDLAKEAMGLETPTQTTGRSVFRTLIPTDRLMADEQIRPLFTGKSPGYIYVPGPDKKTLLFTSPCRNNKVLNVALFHNTSKHHEDAYDWNSEATVDEALKFLEGYHPTWRRIISKADMMKVYTVGYRTECPRMVRGKAIAIGDAAHPMIPTYAQGGSMALEDTAALEVLFSGFTAGENLENRLRIFEQLRLPRVTTTQVLSNGVFIEGNMKEEVVRKYYQGALFEPLDVNGFARPARDFWYGYDIFSEARKAFEYKDGLGGIPGRVLNYFR